MSIKTKVNLIQSSTLEVGLATNSDGYIYFDNGQIVKSGFRLNTQTSKVEYSDDGYSWLYFITPDMGGDISGFSYDANVDAINNYLFDLSSLTDGYVLYYNSSNRWTLGKIAGDVSGNFTNVVVNKINGIEIDTTAPADNSTYIYDLATNKWVPEIIVTTAPIPDYTTGGDSSGDVTNMQIIGFNGYPIETTQIPTNGQVRYYNSTQSKWWCSSIGGDLSGSFDDVNVDALNGINISSTAPTDNQALIYNQLANQWIPGTISTPAFTSLDIASVGGRLTLQTATAYMTDSAGYTDKTTLYWTPIAGGKVALYDSGTWNAFSPGELSISITGLSGNKNYDVFMRYSSGVCSLVFGPAWTDNFTRSVDLTTQDGVYVQASTSYRYLGTIRTYVDVDIDYDILSYETITTPMPSYAFGGVVYDSYHNRIYYIPNGVQVTQDKWYYLDCATNTIYAYDNIATNRPITNAYMGGAYDSTNHRIYFGPASQANQDKWHYVNTDTNTVVAFDNIVGADRPLANAYSGIAFDSTNNRMYFSPRMQSNQAKWHYINTSTNTVVAFNNIAVDKPLSGIYVPYAGAAFDSANSRIYFSPYYQAGQAKWHYIDTSTNTVVAFNNPSADRPLNEAYYGIVYDSAHGRMYFAPFLQSNQSKWHYVTTSTNTVTAYTNNSSLTPVISAYVGAAFDSANNRVYFSPYGQSNDGTLFHQAYHYVDTNTNNVYYYESDGYASAANNAFSGAAFCSTNNRIYFGPLLLTAPWYYINTADNVAYTYDLPSTYIPVANGAYNGSALDTTNNRIYFTPYLQSIQNRWHYLDCSTNTINFINNVTVNRAVGTYAGTAAFDSTHNRIYFAPYTQAIQDYWHYIDCTTNTVVAYANVVTNRAKGSYVGAVFDSSSARVYLIPLAQSNQAYWHYIDTNTNTVVAYAHGLGADTPVSQGYYNGVLESYSDRIYMAPYGQAAQAKWHYIDTSTGNVVAYNNLSVANRPIDYAYNGATFDSVNNRIYFTPDAQTDQGKWHYIKLADNSIKSYNNTVLDDIRYPNIAYMGNGAFISSANRIYLATISSSTGTLVTHYIDTNTNSIIAYDPIANTYDYAYSQAIYNSTEGIVYFTPYYISNQNEWDYIQITETYTSPVTFNYTTSKLGLWNYYNRAKIPVKKIISTASWTLDGGTSWRPFNSDITNCAEVLIGIKEDSIKVLCQGEVDIASGLQTIIGIGLNSSSSDSSNVCGGVRPSSYGSSKMFAIYEGYIPAGYNTIYPIENYDAGVTSSTAYGESGLLIKVLA